MEDSQAIAYIQTQVDDALRNSPRLSEITRAMDVLDDAYAEVEEVLDGLLEDTEHPFWQESSGGGADDMIAPEGADNYDGPYRVHWLGTTATVNAGHAVSGKGTDSFAGRTFGPGEMSHGNQLFLMIRSSNTTGAISTTADAGGLSRNANWAGIRLGVLTMSGTTITDFRTQWQGSDAHVPTYRIPESHSGAPYNYRTTWEIDAFR